MARGNGDVEVVNILLSKGMDESVAERMAPSGTLRAVRNYRLKAGQLMKRAGMEGTACHDSRLLACGAAGTQGGSPSLISRVGKAPVTGNDHGVLSAYDADRDFLYFQGLHSTCKPVRQRYGITSTTPTSGGTALSLGESPPSVAVDHDGNVMTVACDGSGSVCYVYIETPDGVRIFYDSVPTTKVARVVATATRFRVLFQDGTDVSYVDYTVASTGVSGTPSVTISGAVTAATLVHADARWDVEYAREAAKTYVAWQDTSTNVRVKAIGAATTQDVAVGAGSYAAVSLSALEVGTGVSRFVQVWLGLYDDPAGAGVLAYSVLSEDLSVVVLARTALYSPATAFWGPPMFGLYRELGAGQLPPDGHYAIWCVRYSDGDVWATGTGYAKDDGTVLLPPLLWMGAAPISKPDDYHRVWCWAGSASVNQTEARAVLLRFCANGVNFANVELAGPSMEAVPSALSPVDHPTWRYDSRGRASRWPLPGGVDDRTQVFAVPQVLTKVEQSGTDSVLMRVQVLEYQVGHQDPRQCALPLGPTTIVGGQPTAFWAMPAAQYQASSMQWGTAAECGFVHSPTILSITPFPGAGPGEGTYDYVAVYEWADAYGQRHRSAPSATVSITLPAGQVPLLTITAMQLSQRQFVGALVAVVVYRTQSGGTTHQRTAYAVPADIWTNFVGVYDVNTDLDVDENEILYTDGGVLPFSLAPSCRFMCRSEDRVWLGGLWDPTLVQCSRQKVPGEPWEFADHASHQVPLGQDCTGLAYMDGAVVAFTRSDVRIISGEGPSEQGVGSFPTPRIHTSGIGCTNWRSVVETPAGVVFQHGPALYLLPRGLGPLANVSAPVKDTLAEWPAVLAAAYSDGTQPAGTDGLDYPGRQSLARFLLAADTLSGGHVVLTLDLDTMQWTEDLLDGELKWLDLGVWPIRQETATADPSAPDAQSFAVCSTLDRSVAPQGLPIRWEAARAADGGALASGTYVPGLVRTAWVSPFGYAGWCSVKRVVFAYERQTGAGVGASSLTDVTVTLRTDANTTHTATFAVDQGAALGEGVSFLELLPPEGTGRCSSFQVSIADSFNALDGSGRGIRPMSVSVEVEKVGELRPTLPTERA